MKQAVSKSTYFRSLIYECFNKLVHGSLKERNQISGTRMVLTRGI